MAKVIEIDWDPSETTLRQFGFIALGGFGFIAAIAWFEVLVFSFGLGAARQPVALGFLAAGVLSGLLSLIAPRANKPVYLGLTVLTYPIGFVLSYVIMGTLFYLIIAPIGIVMRLLGKDPLENRIQPELDTYWVDAPAQKPSESYFRQF